jgi:hypothetical protein
VPKGAVVAAGGTASFCDATVAKMLYAWGKLKVSGDSQMYPLQFADMTGASLVARILYLAAWHAACSCSCWLLPA